MSSSRLLTLVSVRAAEGRGFDSHAPSALRASRPAGIDVWRVDVSHRVDDFRTGLLQWDDPRDRARRSREASQDSLLAVLSRYLGCRPGDVVVDRAAGGQPYLASPLHRDLRFSMSRSAGRCLIAVGHTAALGVDLERVYPIGDVDRMASRVFAPAEAAAIRAQRGQRKMRTFFNCWTRKEAYAKATGLGLALEFDRFTVSVADEREPRILTLIGDDPSRWRLRSFEPWPGYVAAVATDQPLSPGSVSMRTLGAGD